jgi:hypothetical protein
VQSDWRISDHTSRICRIGATVKQSFEVPQQPIPSIVVKDSRLYPFEQQLDERDKRIEFLQRKNSLSSIIHEDIEYPV